MTTPPDPYQKMPNDMFLHTIKRTDVCFLPPGKVVVLDLMDCWEYSPLPDDHKYLTLDTWHQLSELPALAEETTGNGWQTHVLLVLADSMFTFYQRRKKPA